MLASTDSSQPASEVRLSIATSARSESEPSAPWVGDDPVVARRLDVAARSGEPVRGGLGVAGQRKDHSPLEQACVPLTARRRVRSGPGVHSEVVMIAAGGEEKRSGVARHDAIEAERLVVEA